MPPAGGRETTGRSGVSQSLSQDSCAETLLRYLLFGCPDDRARSGRGPARLQGASAGLRHPSAAGSSRLTKISSTRFAIPSYGKIGLRIFGDRILRGDDDVQRPPLAKCIKRSRVARCIKSHCLRPRCLMCARWFVGVRHKSQTERARRSGRAVQGRKLRSQG